MFAKMAISFEQKSCDINQMVIFLKQTVKMVILTRAKTVFYVVCYD